MKRLTCLIKRPLSLGVKKADARILDSSSLVAGISSSSNLNLNEEKALFTFLLNSFFLR